MNHQHQLTLSDLAWADYADAMATRDADLPRDPGLTRIPEWIRRAKANLLRAKDYSFALYVR